MEDIMGKVETALRREFETDQTKNTSFLNIMNVRKDEIQLYADIQLLKQLEKTNAFLQSLFAIVEDMQMQVNTLVTNSNDEWNKRNNT